MTTIKDYDSMRRFKRVVFHQVLQKLSFLEAHVVWPSGERVLLLDLSFNGLSMAAPLNQSLVACGVYDVQLNFGSSEMVPIAIEIMWVGNTSVGAFFTGLQSDSRIALDHHLKNGLIGQSLSLIDKKFYHQNLHCDYWFQGSEGTNIYVWKSEGESRLSALTFSKDDILIEFENNILNIKAAGELISIDFEVKKSSTQKLSISLSDAFREFLLIISQLATKVEGLTEFLELIVEQQEGL